MHLFTANYKANDNYFRPLKKNFVKDFKWHYNNKDLKNETNIRKFKIISFLNIALNFVKFCVTNNKISSVIKIRITDVFPWKKLFPEL